MREGEATEAMLGFLGGFLRPTKVSFYPLISVSAGPTIPSRFRQALNQEGGGFWPNKVFEAKTPSIR